MMQMMSEIGGVRMPEYFGKLVDDSPAREAPAHAAAAAAAASEAAANKGGSETKR
jgi:hypothetical protein